MDDQDVCYRSLKSNGNSMEEQEISEMIPSEEALEDQRLRKMYNVFRRQASGASAESYTGIRSSPNHRLDKWIEELETKHHIEKK